MKLECMRGNGARRAGKSAESSMRRGGLSISHRAPQVRRCAIPEQVLAEVLGDLVSDRQQSRVGVPFERLNPPGCLEAMVS
jgi:hypothetical protein